MGHDQQIQKMLTELTNAFTQDALSELIDVPQGTISKIKNGSPLPYRQLRNISTKQQMKLLSSLPYRQLRKRKLNF